LPIVPLWYLGQIPRDRDQLNPVWISRKVSANF